MAIAGLAPPRQATRWPSSLWRPPRTTRCPSRTQLESPSSSALGNTWAGNGSPFTYDFEDTVALLAQSTDKSTDKSTVSKLMRVAWETVGSIAARVVARHGSETLLDGLTEIGIDEISYEKHHHYLTIVTDHVRQRVVWVGIGRNVAALEAFFDELGNKRANNLKLVSIDMAGAYIEAVRKRAKNAEIVFDRFHVQRLAHDALDTVRREQPKAFVCPSPAKA